ncbi:uncharacterized protein (DUF2141 family) [Tenacibaculum adriaticum]|uniref:Uncharacterized protein (DUF2141 family) n=1 Tax=Tenacibaculum adriaticum TaxID=413713 RepID=A0A5S5DXL5_9FLAO|nr:DUF2141 domain-containing protein [Tenacibaculum adriaticum]TYP99349.1 uncharacterized protein (DUF2141 family) [Tenacibaculum adriaticum]
MKIVLTLVAWGIMMLTNITSIGGRNITVTVVNATSNQGKINFALYTKEGFRKKPMLSKSAIIENGKSKVVFENVEEGEYAIVCYHDKNNNGRMDFEANGMPLEDYGASNNKLNPFGPPTYESAKFEILDKDVSLEIRF